MTAYHFLDDSNSPGTPSSKGVYAWQLLVSNIIIDPAFRGGALQPRQSIEVPILGNTVGTNLVITSVSLRSGSLGVVTTDGVTITYSTGDTYDYLGVGDSLTVLIDYTIQDTNLEGLVRTDTGSVVLIIEKPLLVLVTEDGVPIWTEAEELIGIPTEDTPFVLVTEDGVPIWTEAEELIGVFAGDQLRTITNQAGDLLMSEDNFVLIEEGGPELKQLRTITDQAGDLLMSEDDFVLIEEDVPDFAVTEGLTDPFTAKQPLTITGPTDDLLASEDGSVLIEEGGPEPTQAVEFIDVFAAKQPLTITGPTDDLLMSEDEFVLIEENQNVN